jgi:hypothetical protein
MFPTRNGMAWSEHGERKVLFCCMTC